MDLTRYASVMQETRHPTRTSGEYRFLSTRGALDVLAEHGWLPRAVDQAGVRRPENHGYQRHLVRLQNPAFDREFVNVGDAKPEIVLKTSHNGETALRLFGGVLELACMNGLVTWRETGDATRVPHRGPRQAERLRCAIAAVSRTMPETFATRERWRTLSLARDEQLAFADAAVAMMFDGEKYRVDGAELLRPRRRSQDEPSLWNVLNRVQENVLSGGLRQLRADGSRVRSRAVKDVDRNVSINRGLWRLAVELEKALN